MKTKKEEIQESDEAATAQNSKAAPAAAVSDDGFSNELNELRWSVISFEKIEAKNLTYDEAAQKLNELVAEKISGLCIITDEAAERI